MRFAALLVIASSSAFAGDSDLGAKIETLARSYAEWGPAMSSPGSALSYQEVSRDGRKRTYHLLVAGLPKDGSYALLQWPVTMDKPAVLKTPVFIDAMTGILLCVKNGNVNSSRDTENLILDSVRGEPVRMAVVSLQDKSQRVMAKITVDPLEATDRNCHLSATYLTGHGEVVFVEAAGLLAGEAFTLSMHSGSKEVKQNANASASGDYRISFLPFDPKNVARKGRAVLHLQAASCSPTLDFPWGDLAAQ